MTPYHCNRYTGITLTELFNVGITPYANLDNHKVISAVLEGYTIPKPADCPESLFTSIIKPCWMMEPKKRPSFRKILRIFDSEPAMVLLFRNHPKVGMDHFNPRDLLNGGEAGGAGGAGRSMNDQSVYGIAADAEGQYYLASDAPNAASARPSQPAGGTATSPSTVAAPALPAATDGAAANRGEGSTYAARSGGVAVPPPGKAPPRFQRVVVDRPVYTLNQTSTHPDSASDSTIVKIRSKSSQGHHGSSSLPAVPVLGDYVDFRISQNSSTATVAGSNDVESTLPTVRSGHAEHAGEAALVVGEHRSATSAKTFRTRKNKVSPLKGTNDPPKPKSSVDVFREREHI